MYKKETQNKALFFPNPYAIYPSTTPMELNEPTKRYQYRGTSNVEFDAKRQYQSPCTEKA